MELVQRTTVEEFDGETLWALHRRAFPRRRRLTAQPHALSREEFEATLRDPRVTKLLLIDRTAGTRVAGLASLTDDLGAVPAGSRVLLADRWPAHAGEQRLWFVSFLVVDPDYQHTGAATHLVGGIWARAAAHGGIVAIDTARFNDTTVRLASALFHQARSFSPGPPCSGWTTTGCGPTSSPHRSWPDPAAPSHRSRPGQRPRGPPPGRRR